MSDFSFTISLLVCPGFQISTTKKAWIITAEEEDDIKRWYDSLSGTIGRYALYMYNFNLKLLCLLLVYQSLTFICLNKYPIIEWGRAPFRPNFVNLRGGLSALQGQNLFWTGDMTTFGKPKPTLLYYWFLKSGLRISVSIAYCFWYVWPLLISSSIYLCCVSISILAP